MGHLSAQGMAEFGGVNAMTIHWHLSSNHYPPYPGPFITDMTPVILDAIEKANDEEWDAVLQLPEVVRKGESTTVTVGELIESLRLEAFLAVEGEDA